MWAEGPGRVQSRCLLTAETCSPGSGGGAQGWMKSIENAKAGLQATLIVRHPESGRLLVNFDKEIMQLMRETKYLQRMGVEVPESAKMVLLQEEKFKLFYNELGCVSSRVSLPFEPRQGGRPLPSASLGDWRAGAGFEFGCATGG